MIAFEEAQRLAGSVLLTGFPGIDLDPQVEDTLLRLSPSGVILFRRNFADAAQLRRLVARLHDLPSQPLVAIDHEGGPVMRLTEPFTHFPAARQVAATGDPDVARRVGRAMARELRAVGIDVDFAPVLDVDSNPANPIIGTRSFGRSPADVIRFALPFLRGLEEGGVRGCAKHFPGHGDTAQDSHLELPVVRAGRDRLEEIEMAPFAAAVAAGVAIVMTAHVVYPALDPECPATLSRRILQEELRQRLGFRGVIASDDLEMRGISAWLPVPEAALRALEAGVDWLLVCNDLDLSVRTVDRIAHALREGRLDTSRLAESAARIRALRRPHEGDETGPLPAAEHAALKTAIEAATAVV